MSEKYLTYSEIKKPPGKKQKQTKQKKIEENIIYSEVKTHPSNANKTKKTKANSFKQKGSSFPISWRLAVLILGIICFFLLLATGVLGFIVLQAQLTKEESHPLQNLTQRTSTCKTVASKEEENPDNTGSGLRDMCTSQWSCCNKKCYYISHESKTFHDSRESCKTLNSRLLKMEDEKEQNYIQKQIYYFYWIGLSRKGISSSWTWEDGTKPSLKLKDWKESPEGNCAIMSSTKVIVADCSKKRNYICEKKTPFLAT